MRKHSVTTIFKETRMRKSGKILLFVFFVMFVMMSATMELKAASEDDVKRGTITFIAEVPEDFETGINITLEKQGNTGGGYSDWWLRPNCNYEKSFDATIGRYYISGLVQGESSNLNYKLAFSQSEIVIEEGESYTVYVYVSSGAGVSGLQAATDEITGAAETKESEDTDSTLADSATGTEYTTSVAKEMSEQEIVITEASAQTNRIFHYAKKICLIGAVLIFVAILLGGSLLKLFKVRLWMIVGVVVLCGIAFVCNRMESESTSSSIENVEITLQEADLATDELPATQTDDSDDGIKTEVETSAKTTVSVMTVGESTLHAVYKGSNWANGYYGYFGSLMSEIYDKYAESKKNDTTSPAGLDALSGGIVYLEAGTYYTYSGVEKVYYDTKNHLDEEYKEYLRDDDDRWIKVTESNMSRIQYRNELVAGKAILNNGASWGNGSIICNGFLLSESTYLEEDGRYWIPLEAIVEYMPYTGIENGRIYVLYAFGDGIKIPIYGEDGEKTYTYNSDNYIYSDNPMEFEAYYLMEQEDGWYVEAETFMRITGIAVYVGDGLMVICSNEKDIPDVVIYYPYTAFITDDIIVPLE